MNELLFDPVKGRRGNQLFRKMKSPEIARLKSLTYRNGETLKPGILFELIQTIEEIGQRPPKGMPDNRLDTIIENVKNTLRGSDFPTDKEIIFNLPVFTEEKARYNRDIFHLKNAVELMEGHPCPKCNFEHTRLARIQMRSADEPTATRITCFNPKCKGITTLR